VIVNLSPIFNSTGRASFKVRVRIFGPERSTSIESGRPSFAAASLERLILSACSSWVPCDMFMRTALMPASISASIADCVLVAGPRVAKIFAFLI
jgi:hypothetical protein